ncbi:MAG TPA: hypothetical protein ENI64_06365 [Gammaproteobacteria bacterium]|nr:hypothetical protein [Gammaproteobacteria bacterium]
MLQAIRDRATGWFAWLIVGLLIIPFALWGVSEYLGGGGVPEVATINDTIITRDVLARQVDMQLRDQRQRPEGAAFVQFQRAVLERMIREELLVQAAREAGMRISDEQLASVVRNIESFQVDGKFDKDLFKQLLRDNGYSVAAYEQERRRDLLVRQFVQGIQSSEFSVAGQVDMMSRLQGRKIDLVYTMISAEGYRQKLQPDDASIQAYFEVHRDKFVKPAQVKVDYIKLDIRDIEELIHPDEAALHRLYNEVRDTLGMNEQRRVAHILVSVDTPDAEQAALAKITKIRSELDAGADFSEWAKKYSDDSGSAAQGGDLGTIEKGVLDPAFEDAAMALKQGETSEPVRSQFGYHLIKLTELKPGDIKTFEQARDELAARYKLEEAEKIYYERFEQLQDLAYENHESLDVPASTLGLKIEQSEFFDQRGGEGIAEFPQVVKAAFSEDVLAAGDLKRASNSGLIELPQKDSTRPKTVIVVHAAEYVAERPLELGEARATISKQLESIAVNDAMTALADEFLEKLKAGGKLEQLAKENKLEYKTAKLVARSDPAVDKTVLEAAFRLGKPSDGNHLDSKTYTAKGDLAVFSVLAVEDGDAAAQPEAMRGFIQQMIQAAQADDNVRNLVASLRRSAEVKVFESRLIQQDNN